MNFDKFNQWLTLLANLGVLLGIVFLALEMRQNTEMMKAQTRDSITEKQANWYMAIATDPNAARILAITEGVEVPREVLNAENGDGIVYGFTQHAIFRLWENELYQYEMGLFDEEEFLARKAVWRSRVLNNPGTRAFWSTVRNLFSSGFREEMDSLVQAVEN